MLSTLPLQSAHSSHAHSRHIRTRFSSNASCFSNSSAPDLALPTEPESIIPSYNCLVAPGAYLSLPSSRRSSAFSSSDASPDANVNLHLHHMDMESASLAPAPLSPNHAHLQNENQNEVGCEAGFGDFNMYDCADCTAANANLRRRSSFESIVDDINKLYDLTSTFNPISDAITMSVHISSDGEEHHQGSVVTGYMIIENRGAEPIPFEMYYVTLEGSSTVLETRYTKYRKRKQPLHEQRFLEMIDFTGSYNPNLFDSDLFAGSGSVLLPGTTYTTPFWFRIPHQLVESACQHNPSTSHCQLPPSFGIPLGSKTDVNDHAYTDTSISYRVVGRFIGRKQDYGATDSVDDLVTLKSALGYIRVVGQYKTPPNVKNSSMVKPYFDLMSNLRQKVEEGKEMKRIRAKKEQAPPPYLRDEPKTTKMAYSPVYRYNDPSPDYSVYADNSEYVLKLTKRGFAGEKTVGSIGVYAPNTEVVVKYIPPQQFRNSPVNSKDLDTWTLKIPVTLDVQQCGDSKPQIRSIRTELVMMSLRSDECAIPFEIDYDLILGKDRITSRDCDEDRSYKHIIRPMKDVATQLYKLSKEIGTETLQVEKSAAIDLRSVCKLKEKCTVVTVQDVKVDTGSDLFNATNGSKLSTWQSKKTEKSNRQFNLLVNLASTSELKKSKTGGYDEHCLVPTFQSCHFSRLYYVRICLEFSYHNEQYAYIKVPVIVENS
ncbi:predicted protein [Scheffersomyces stipitis CBS 6054]|uniref:Bul1 C-terminal domain-containing protein n=1 Tax=Scheffersomyces stipitis (strain ATCC 58785 / CBS 6054 / NBRC 10063 / NRRL Y-11545) TaxID=322104 RepID=A3LRU1_PICST|nr:predicted protein [Scheffersomyces stipitis CBS 6054]ABN65448.2 predicted protein [Scheffersomyces stipitis CBS 6054]KAG2733469.1 hypothetical protein G9P44_002994 [Scheffersomyces stipitis]